jgi:NTP pyrophosphatase (non-canonical NTP hydrolase)
MPTFDEYQLKAAETAVHPGSDNGYGGIDAATYLALGLNGEAGEVAEVIKKVLRDDAGAFTAVTKDKLLKEMGDVLWYLARLADVTGFSLEVVAQFNLDKLADRKQRLVLNGSGDNR